MRSRYAASASFATLVLFLVSTVPAVADERADRWLRPPKSALPFPERGEAVAKAAVSDPTGDTFGTALDITRFEAVVRGSMLDITIDFDGEVSAPDSGMFNALDGFIDLDIDQDGSTGDLSWTDFVRTDGGSTGLGNEFYVDLAGWSSISGTVEVWNDATEEIAGFVDASLSSDRLAIQIPLGLLGDDGAVDTAAVLGYFLDFSDLVPNSGSLASDATTGGGGTGVLLQGDRFLVDVEWDTGTETGFAEAATVSDDSAVLYFFEPDNWEMLLKVLDGCGLNNRFWVFFAATTDVGFTVSVTDTQSGQMAQYSNPRGTPADAVTDTEAFATCP